MHAASPLLVYLLFLLSGCTGLIYEIVWTRELILVIGGTTYAITTVLVAFMFGLALGSHLAGQRADRLDRPGRVYGLLEMAIGGFALLVPLLLDAAEPLYRACYPRVADMPWVLTALRFLIGAIVLAVPATCMGATLPLLVRYLTVSGRGFGRSVGLLYGINTCGAVLGTLLAGFWLLPAVGLTRTTWIAAAINLAIGLVAFKLLKTPVAVPAVPLPLPVQPARHRKQPRPRDLAGLAPTFPADVRRAVLITAAVSGFAAMVYQIAWTRALIMSLGSSTYAFTCILAAFILGLGIGSLIIAHSADRRANPVLVIALLELGIAWSAVLIVPIHGWVPVLVRDLVTLRQENYGALLASEFVLVIAITFVPTVCMGAVFPLVSRVVASGNTETHAAAAVGRAYAVNTLGTIFGSLLAGFVLIRSDVLGAQNSIVAAALLNALVGGWLLVKARPVGSPAASRLIPAAIAVLGVLLMGQFVGQWNRLLLTSAPFRHTGRPELPRELLFYREGVDMTVSVEQIGGEEGGRTLSINGKPDASNTPSDVRTQLLLGHVPALLDRGGKRACVIGLGSGMTLAAVARYESYELLDCVEISDAVIEAASWFVDGNNRILTDDPRVTMIRADGRNHLLLTPDVYDLIVSEPSNPWLAGVSNLFTREFFDLARRRLTPDGRLAIWLHSYSMSMDDFRMVVHTLFDVFQSVTLWEFGDADYCLVASADPSPAALKDLQRRYSAPPVEGDLFRVALRDLGGVLGNFVTNGPPLREWAAGAPVHTDDNAVLEFSAPFNLYRRDHVAIAQALMALQRSPFEDLILTDAGDAAASIVRTRVDSAIEARRARVSAAAMWEQERYQETLATLLQAYRQDPGNFLVYQKLLEYQSEIVDNSEASDWPSTMIALLQGIDVAAEPIVVSPQGDTRQGVVNTLISLADSAAAEQQWWVAADYLVQAREMAPDDPRVAASLADALEKDGRTEQAATIRQAITPNPAPTTQSGVSSQPTSKGE